MWMQRWIKNHLPTPMYMLYVFRSAGNTSKNRYKDVVCYDSTRVLLNKMEDKEVSDVMSAWLYN